MKLRSLLDPNIPDLSFDDVLLEPGVTEVSPDEVSLRASPIKGLSVPVPILSAHMSTVASAEAVVSMGEIGALGTMHREMSLEHMRDEVARLHAQRIDAQRYRDAVVREGGRPVSIFACSPYDHARADALLEDERVDYVIMDNVQPLHRQVIKAVEGYARRFPDRIIVGNIATRHAAEIYSALPLAALKVGLGPGSICTTRVVSGCGVAQLTAIAETHDVAARRGIPIIADGGIRSSGDIVKALAAGADGVMLGKLLAGCDEAPGQLVQHESGHLYKKYEGARYTSVEIPETTGYPKIDDYLRHHRRTEDLRVEGTSGLVPYRGPIQLIIYNLVRGARLGFAFVGAESIAALRERATFRWITTATQGENRDNLIVRTSTSFL